MLLLDAIYIDKSGGKILLDYLIDQLEQTENRIFYLLDLRLKNKLPNIKPANEALYVEAGIRNRYNFYVKNKHKFTKILCFSNLPPYIRTSATVYTYFHQPLIIYNPLFANVKLWLSINVRRIIIKYCNNNTDYWLVQSDQIKQGLLERFSEILNSKVKILPFYKKDECSVRVADRTVNSFIYVSSAAPHKNQRRLLDAFVAFYDKHHIGELHLTIDDDQKLLIFVAQLNKKKYPIINHGFMQHDNVILLYNSCQYAIYPSLTESFGLGIIEGIQNGCKMLGADRAYMHAICEPSLLFDPESVDDMFLAFEKACFTNLRESKLLVQDKINDLISLLN